MLVDYDRLVPKLHEFDGGVTISGTDPRWSLSSRPEYGCQEAFAYLVQRVADLKSLTRKMISGDDNRCSHVYSLSANGTPVMILKYAKRAKYEADVLREFVLTRRYLNPLRILTPNIAYAYNIIPPKGENGHFKAIYEFVRGKPFDEAVVNMTPTDFVGSLLQICFTLQIAQEACMLTHYDLHGGNILVERKPFKHTYILDGMSYTVTCNYEVKFIDFGYSFAAGCGVGMKQPGMYGASDLTHAKIYPDMFSTGFDYIKIVGFIHKVLKKYNKLRDFKSLDWLWERYVTKQYKSMKDAKDCLYSISYSDPHNYLTPQSFIQELLDKSESLCMVVSTHSKEGMTPPPEVFLCQMFPVAISRTYQHYLENSNFNNVYRNAWKQMYNWFYNAKVVVPEPRLYVYNSDETDAHYTVLQNLYNTTGISKGSISTKTKDKYKEIAGATLACTLRLSQQPKKDWKILQRYRIYYRPVAYVNTSTKIRLKDIIDVYVSKFSGDENTYKEIAYISLDDESFTRLDDAVGSLSGSRTDIDEDSREQAIDMIRQVQKRYPRSETVCSDAIKLLESETKLIVTRVKYTGKLKLYCTHNGKEMTIVFVGTDEVYLDQKRKPLNELIRKL